MENDTTIRIVYTAVFIALLLGCGCSRENDFKSIYAAWKYGPSKAEDFFFFGAWLQEPEDAVLYKKIGINAYVGLWHGPAEEQLALLRTAGMPVICAQNETARKHLQDPLIIGWMQPDEPDNAQTMPDGSYGPCLSPADLTDDYLMWKGIDPYRPVYLGLGQGVADINYRGRGERCGGRWQMYADYLKACDIVTYDIYPANRPSGKLWMVPKGIDSLYSWSSDRERPVWCTLECTQIGPRNRKPTVDQVRSEVWMSIIHGARGIIYFCHGAVKAGIRYTAQDLPDPEMLEAVNKIREDIDRRDEESRSFYYRALLADAGMMLALKEINGEVRALAPVINSPTLTNTVRAVSSDTTVPIDIMVKRKEGALYIFAAAMRSGTATGTFSITGMPRTAEVEVLGENRKIQVKKGTFSDVFGSYTIRRYRIRE